MWPVAGPWHSQEGSGLKAPGGFCLSFLSPSPTPLSPPVPKAQGILRREELLSLFQLSPFCSSYLLNSEASSVTSCQHLILSTVASRKKKFLLVIVTEPGGGAKKGVSRELWEGERAHTPPSGRRSLCSEGRAFIPSMTAALNLPDATTL